MYFKYTMPIPKPNNKEKKSAFISRCISEISNDQEFKSQDQKIAICYKQFEDTKSEASASISFNEEEFLILDQVLPEECDNDLGYEEEVTAENFYIPEDKDYVSIEEVEYNESEIIEYDLSANKPGLWENIRKKKEKQGKNYKPAKPGDKDRPSKEAWKKAQASEYQGKKVTLNKPFRTSGGPKKFAVYVKNESGNVVIVRFGDPNMKIKKNIPARRKSFRARHNCDNPGPKWKARYWACKSW